MSVFKNELVLYLVQPYLKCPVDHVNSKLVSKYLLKTGNNDPDRPKPSTGQFIEYSRKKKDQLRLELHASKLGLKQVYTVNELARIHEEVKKQPNYDILDVNVSIEYLKTNTFHNSVDAGWYIPVMYKRQKLPLYSLIFAEKNHTAEEASEFVNALEKLRIHALYHNGKSDEEYEMAQLTVDRGNPEDTPPVLQDIEAAVRFLYQVRRYREAVKLMAENKRPFSWRYCTTMKRWDDLHSDKHALITIG